MAASTHLITDTSTAIAGGQTANTVALAENPTGPIMDQLGMMHSLRLTLKEANVKATLILRATDPGDPAYAYITNVLASLS